MAYLEITGIEKSFGHNKVLKGIDFSLDKGQTVSIIGSSGSGKTTLLRCINFLEKPNLGTVKLDGSILFDGSQKKNIKEKIIRRNRLHFGLVFQSFNLFPQYTVLENVMLAPKLLFKDNPEKIKTLRGECEAIIENVGLIEKLNFYPSQLSGGQQQRVAIARALALDPEILCFDEPTSALDPELTGEVLRVIRDLRDKKITMIIVTHEMNFAREVSDKVIFMDDGRVVEQGSPEKLFTEPKTQRLKEFLGAML